MVQIFTFFLFLQLIAGCVAEQPTEDQELDPKDAFFRNLKPFDSQQYNYDGSVPKPFGFLVYVPSKVKRSLNEIENHAGRPYHVLVSPGLTSHFKINVDDDTKRFKRHVVSKLINETSNEEDEQQVKHQYNKAVFDDDNSDKLVINDFIRFKREDTKTNDQDSMARLKREPEIKTDKSYMERGYSEPGADREPRGSTKEQWIKQPYPVERSNERPDDNIPSASENIRAPRVHFVTQRRSRVDTRQPELLQPQSPPPPPPPFYYRGHDDREARAKDFDSYGSHSQQVPYYSRPRSYDPYRPRYYDPFYDRYDDIRSYNYDNYDLRYINPEPRPLTPIQPNPPPLLPPVPATNKQRRIIYYATLPEVVRSPTTNTDNRFRNRYQDGYDNRYINSANIPPPGVAAIAPGPANGASTDAYRIRKSSYNNQLQKQRDYDRSAVTDRKKTPLYPVKVSTDVNVRDTKKNPERRIYSDVERRYNNYKAPSFQTAEDGHF